MHPFHTDVQETFPDFDYRNPVGDRSVILDYSNPGNKVGHQQRAFSAWWALNRCGPLDLGLDLGAHRGLTPYCIHVDLFGNGQVHPFYGGGEYRSDVVWDASNTTLFAPGTFNLINSNHSLEHMPSPSGDAGIVDLLARWIGLLRAGGVLAMIIPDNAHFDVMASDKDHKHAWSHDDFRWRILDPVLANCPVDLVDYDTLQNRFSFDVVLRKR